MNDFDNTIIPLDDAQAILAAFGIGGENREYPRWVRDDGFRWGDFENVLNTSRRVLGVDWREWLQDAVDIIAGQLEDLDAALHADLGEDGEQGTIEVGGNTERIKYVPNDDDDFDTVIAAVNRLIAQQGRYHKLRSCEGSDGWRYALLSDEAWAELESTAPQTLELLFGQ